MKLLETITPEAISALPSGDGQALGYNPTTGTLVRVPSASAAVAGLNAKGGVFYPEDFGPLSATGAISHIAIQAAIDAAAVLGGTVVLPPQKMLLGASLVPKSGVTIRGTIPAAPSLLPWDLGYSLVGGTILSFPGGVIFHQDTSASFATHTGLSDFCLYSMGFDGFAKVISSGAQSKHGCLGCMFENLVAINGTDTALEIINPQHVTIRKVTLRLVRRGAFFGSSYRIGEVDCAPGNSVIDELYVQLDDEQDTNYGVKCENMAGTQFMLGVIEFRRLQVNRFKTSNKLGNHLVLKGITGYPVVALTFSALDLEGYADAVVSLDTTEKCELTIVGTSPPAEWNACVRVANSTGLVISSTQRDTRVELVDDTSAGATVGIGIFQDTGITAKKLRGCYATNAGFVWQYDAPPESVITGSGYRLGFGGVLDGRAAMQMKVGTWDYATSDTIWVQYTSGTITASATTDQTLTLPSYAANGAEGETITIIKIGASGVLTIANVAGGNVTVNTTNASVQLRATAAGWRVIGRYLT